MEVASDVISDAGLEQVGMDVSVKFGNSTSNDSPDIREKGCVGWYFDHFWNVNNCQAEVASDVISSMAVQDFSMDVYVKFGYSRLKTSKASFWCIFRTPMTSDWK